MGQEVVFTPLRQLEHWRIDQATEQRILRLARNAQPLLSVQQVHDSFAEIDQLLSRYPLRSWGVLFDMREVRPAHNPEIERAFKENRERSYKAFGRYGVLVATVAGQMQVRRMLREMPDPRIEVFTDEAEAIEWVRAKDSFISIPPPSRREHRD